MKPLTKKVVEAGLVPRHTLELMKHWQLVPDGAREADVSDADQEKMLEFVRDIAVLLEDEQDIPEIKETVLDADVVFEDAVMTIAYADTRPERTRYDVQVARDRLGNFLIPYVGQPTEIVARPGTRIWWKDGAEFEVVEVLPSYEEDKLTWYVCRVQEVPDHAKMRRV